MRIVSLSLLRASPAVSIFFFFQFSLAVASINSFTLFPPSSKSLNVDGIQNKQLRGPVSKNRNKMLLFVSVINLQGSIERQSLTNRMLEQGILSIAKFYPGASVLILYGEVGKKPELKLSTRINVQIEEVKTSCFNLEKEYTSYGRMKAYSEVITNELKRSVPRGIIFYDADMLFIGNHLRGIFYSSIKDWTVGLTFRNMKKFPVNCGLMLVSQHNLLRGLQFWSEILFYYEKETTFQGSVIRKENPMADQLATCKVIESLGGYYMKPIEHVRRLRSMNETSILLLPTKRWNWTPKPMCYIDSRCAVLHFKGNKKIHMAKASKLLHNSKDTKPSNIFRDIAKLGQDPRSTRRTLKKGCSD